MKRTSLIILDLFTATLVLAVACSAPEPTNTPAPRSESEINNKRWRPIISTVGDELKFDRAELRETNQASVKLIFVNASKIN